MWLFKTSKIKKLKSSGNVASLIDALNDESTKVRKSAVEALGEIGGTGAVKPLLLTLKDKDKRVRKTAAESLEKLGWKPEQVEYEIWYRIARNDWEKVIEQGPTAVETLLEILKDKEYQGRLAIIGSLGSIGDARAVEILIRIVNQGRKESSDLDILAEVNEAIEALGKIGDPRAIDPLVLALQDGVWGENEVSANAAAALGKIGDVRAVEPLLKQLDEVGQLLHYAKTNFNFPKETLGNQMKNVYGSALSEISDPRAVEMLIECLADTSPHRLINYYHYAAKALGKIGNPRATEALVDALNDKNKGLRKVAAEVLEKHGWKPD